MNPILSSLALGLVLAGCANAPGAGTPTTDNRAPESKPVRPSATAQPPAQTSNERPAATAPSPRPTAASSPVVSTAPTPTPERKPTLAPASVSDPKQVSIVGLDGTYDVTGYSDFYALVADLRSRSPGTQHGASWNVISGLVGSFQQPATAANRARRDAIAQKEEADQLAAAKAKFRDSVIDTWGKPTLKSQPTFKVPFDAGKQDLANWYKEGELLIIPNRTESLQLSAALGEPWSQQISRRIGSPVAIDGLPKVEMAWISTRARDSRPAGLHLPATLEQAKRIRDAVTANRTLYVVVNQYNWRVSGLNWLVMRLNPLGGSIVDESGKALATFGPPSERVEARVERPMKAACRKNEADYVSAFCPMTMNAFQCVFAKKAEYKKLCVD